MPLQIYAEGPAALRLAFLALAGRIYRNENYGCVENQGIGDQRQGTVPYTIEQFALAVTLVQPGIDGHDAVVQVVERESAVVRYEQNASDPRVHHQLNIQFDQFGQILRTAIVDYPRRSASVNDILLPGQAATSFQLRTFGLINHLDGGYENSSGGPLPPLTTQDGLDFHLLSVPFEQRTYQIGGFTAPAPWFSYTQVQAMVNDALNNTLEYGQPFAETFIQARLFQWEQDYYWNTGQTTVLPLQQISAMQLLHRQQSAVLSAPLIASVYGTKVDDAQLGECGYQQQDGYWWSWGNWARYYDASAFYQVAAATDPFGNTTSLTLDSYKLAVIAHTDPAGYVSTSDMDYQALKPARVTDVNQVISEALYDPLGQIQVTALYQLQEGKPVGDTPLAQYLLLPEPTTAQLLADPMTYLQGAGSYVHQDLLRNIDSSDPACTAVVERHRFANPSQDGAALAAGSPPFGLALAYFDGAQRQVSMVRLVSGEPPFLLSASEGALAMTTDAASWLVEQRLRFDRRGNIAEQYVPFYTLSPTFCPDPALPAERLYYDAMGRRVRLVTTKGFLVLEEYAAWCYQRWDEDDSVEQSPYYQQHINDPDLPLLERQALEKARVFSNTPTINQLDTQGRVIQKTGLLTRSGVPGMETLSDYHWLDSSGNEIATTDARFWSAQQPEKPAFYTYLATYDMAQQAIDQRSADAGNVPLATRSEGVPMLTLLAADRRAVCQWDQRGYKISRSYNALRQPTGIYVQGNGVDQWIEKIEYGSDPTQRTVNRVVAYYDQAGICTVAAYTLNDDVVSHTRQYRQDYRQEANWNASSSIALESQIWTTCFSYDAVGHVLTTTLQDFFTLNRSYYCNGWVSTISLSYQQTAPQPLLASASYIATGEPQTLLYANGMQSRYEYDPQMLRVTRMTSQTQAGTPLRQLGYTYDPRGNVSYVTNATPVPGSDNDDLSGDGDYGYDSLYRLLSATGRQQIPSNASSDSALERYSESYTYDRSGNLTVLNLLATQAVSTTLSVSDSSNHAVPEATLKGKTPDAFFDAAGNLLWSEEAGTLSWYSGNHLASAVGENGVTSYYQYAFNRHRTRKVEIAASGDLVETLYLDDFVIELSRSSQQDNSPQLLSCAVNVLQNDRLLAVVSALTGEATLAYRYVLADRLWSVGLEIDSSENTLTFNEYRPYGSSAISLRVVPDTAPARYRYIQQEKDRETGFYAIGQRYYLAGQGRWISPDPAGTVDGQNLFMYVQGNPVTDHDITGENGDPPGGKPKSIDNKPDIKKALKYTSLTFTVANAVLDSVLSRKELTHAFFYPYQVGNNMWTSALHGVLLSKVGMGAAGGGLAGMGYYGMSMKKEGFTRVNTTGFLGSMTFFAEGVAFYHAMSVSHSGFHHAMRRIGFIGGAADVLKSYSYFTSARTNPDHRMDYFNALGYGFLGSANLLSTLSSSVQNKYLRQMKMTSPQQIIFGAAMLMMPTLLEHLMPTQSSKKGQGGHH